MEGKIFYIIMLLMSASTGSICLNNALKGENDYMNTLLLVLNGSMLLIWILKLVKV